MKKNSRQPHPGAAGASQKTHSHDKKIPSSKQTPGQTRQPYEQDTKRRIGQFSGAGEPPLMKK